ncbi:putative serine threonine-protein kinase gad8, partial [Parachaetomium inaequale]
MSTASASLPPASPASLLPSTPSFPGILTVTLHEGVDFSAAEQHRHLFEGYERNLGTPDRPSYRRQFHLPYALLDYEKSQVSVEAILGSTENPRWRVKCGSAYKFDVSRAAALSIHLYLKDPRACKGSQDVLLGVARVNPFDGWTVSGPQWLNVQGGTGKVLISLEYTQADIDRSEFTLLDVFQFEKKNTQRRYTRKVIRAAQLGSFPDEAAVQINHPFIAPLAFSCQSPKGLELCVPFVSGGHLLNHLQRPQRLDIDRAKFYAAEILCALDYLHDAGIVSWLKPGNVMLDSLGHVTVCGFGLFTRQFRNDEQVIYRRPEYPAPELLLDERSTSKAADWWTLGVLLFEMLTGLPPFYDNDTEKIRSNILDQPLEFPEFLPPSATDILAKLLERSPGKRLGTGGAAEVKAHPFFQDIDWEELFRRRYEPVFKPAYCSGSFEHHGVDYPPERWLFLEERLQQFSGFAYTRP